MRPSKRVLTIKPPRTRSSTEVNCSESNTNLGSDEVAEPEAEAISKENSDANSLGSNNGVLGGIYQQSIEDNTKNQMWLPEAG